MRRWQALELICSGLILGACDAVPSVRNAPRLAPAIGAPAPAYHAVGIDGDSVTLLRLRGNVVLLNVWATWCVPCREELPALERLHRAHAARGLQLIGVSVDARGEGQQVRDFARSFGVTYPIWLDPEERVSTTFLAIGVPTSYLIGRNGTLRWRHIGPVRDTDPALLRALERALTESAN